MEEHGFPRLVEKLTLRLDLELLTGLHIGGNDTGIGIGGADKLVVRTGREGLPYLPGSSLKGKLRSLVERAGSAKGLRVEPKDGGWECKPCACAESECPVCLVFGVAAERHQFEPGRPHAGAARLLVRDGSLANKEQLERYPYLDMACTEVKTEVAIDRLTSTANPRQFERVPAGALFQSRLILNLFASDPRDALVDLLLQGLRLLSADHLGGQGSRGYGAVKVVLQSAQSLRIGADGVVESAPLDSLGSASLRLPVAFDLGAELRAAA